MNHLIKSTLLILSLLFPIAAHSHDFEVDGIYYNINGTNVTVTYKGNYSSSYSNEYSGSVTIPATVTYNGTTYSVTNIGNSAFRDCTNLTTVNIPNSVTTIGGGAFIGSSSLTNISVASDNPKYDSRNNCNAIIETATNTLIVGCKNTTIPNSVTNIGNSAFSGCSSLTNIYIPNSVTNIGYTSFAGCSSLTNINIPNSVTTIGDGAFDCCSGLNTVNIPNSVTTIGIGVFSYCSSLTNISVASNNPKYDSRNNCNAIIETATNTLIAGCKNTTIPNSVTTIGNAAFSCCTSLININIPNSVTNIGEGGFSGCSSLTTINIPNSVTSICYDAFFGCSSLTTVNIPNSVTNIYPGAFYYCDSLNNVYCYATTPPECIEYYGDPSSVFTDYSATLHVPATSLATYFTAPVWSNFENIVGDAVAPTGIAISRDSVEIQSGEQFELTATVTPANASCKEVTWYSTDTSVATVEDGVVTAVGYGECDIFAYCMGMPAICHITVINRISLGQQEAMLLPNHMLTLTPSAPAMPAGFTATSSDPTVAAVRLMNGKVQVVGIKEGTTTITVASTDGTAQPATCLVTVYTEPGDVNCDGFATIGDVTQMIDYLLGGAVDNFKVANADVNGDGTVSIGDATTLIDQLLSGSN